MATPPNRNDENNAGFRAGAQNEPLPPQKKKRTNQDEDESIIEDAVDEVMEHVNFGCLLRPFIWIATLPIRIILRVIEAIFD